ncbi:hypothetical protein WMY93_033237 [Mugilogobius chulae]|uniref:Uncharacterized protein n=1 Tax=Mugilogobius chulae TaxID=88201 RepID=A0AAW0MP71_9GOBI
MKNQLQTRVTRRPEKSGTVPKFTHVSRILNPVPHVPKLILAPTDTCRLCAASLRQSRSRDTLFWTVLPLLGPGTRLGCSVCLTTQTSVSSELIPDGSGPRGVQNSHRHHHLQPRPCSAHLDRSPADLGLVGPGPGPVDSVELRTDDPKKLCVFLKNDETGLRKSVAKNWDSSATRSVCESWFGSGIDVVEEEEAMTTKVKLRLKLGSADLSDPVLQESLLNQVKQKLGEAGVVGVKLKLNQCKKETSETAPPSVCERVLQP